MCAVRTLVRKYECIQDLGVFPWLMYSIEAMMVVYGVYLCIRVKGVPSHFGESQHIAVCLYAVMFDGTLLAL